MSVTTISLPTSLLDSLAATKVEKGITPCDDRCMFAEGTECDCECQGKNHQQGSRLTAVQMFVPRTPAGRRIKTMARNTAEFRQAVRWAKMRDVKGMTQKDIAAAEGVSAPCVRRALRGLAWTLALTEAQQAEQH